MSINGTSVRASENERGSLTHWSIYHPIGISMLMLTVVIFGLFSFERLGVSLLPDIIYPDIRVRVLDEGVSVQQMEYQVTRHLEEQLSITENVSEIRSNTSTGRSAVNLSFPYGTDIDSALQDASSRLDRAKRFLPTTISPPVIYKRDPSQIAVMEYIISAEQLTPVELTQWMENQLKQWLINIPGVASVEIGGGLDKEIQIHLDTSKLQNLGLSPKQVAEQINAANHDFSAGRLDSSAQEFSTNIKAQLSSVEELSTLPINSLKLDSNQNTLHFPLPLSDLATIIDGSEPQRLFMRFNQQQGIKLSIQKQPEANTITVVQGVKKAINHLSSQNLVPDGVEINLVSDRSTFVQYALKNASLAALSGLILAIIVVYLFLHNWKKTLIIASALPLAVCLTFIMMDALDLNLNIMTLGGLALAMGLLVDNTIIMLENISRHLSMPKEPGKKIISPLQKAYQATGEISSALVASTSTNLVAIIPFIFIGGLSGLLFSDLFLTIIIAIIASLIVALTLVPSYSARLGRQTKSTNSVPLQLINKIYQKILGLLLKRPLLTLLIFIILFLVSAYPIFVENTKLKHIFLPKIDEGHITIGLRGEVGMPLQEMEQSISKLEQLLSQDPLVKQVYSTVGGFIFGRSQFERSNRGTIKVQLNNQKQSIFDSIALMTGITKASTNSTKNKEISSKKWIKSLRKRVNKLKLTGIKISYRTDGIRGVRFGNNEEEIEIRIQGHHIPELSQLGDDLIKFLKQDPLLKTQLKNLSHTYDDFKQEVQIIPNRQQMKLFNISLQDLHQAISLVTEGFTIGDLNQNGVYPDIKLYQQQTNTMKINQIQSLIISYNNQTPIILKEVAEVTIAPAPLKIEREKQQRINEISASLQDDDLSFQVQQKIMTLIPSFELPKGYTIYVSGNHEEIQHSEKQSQKLMALAIFLVFVVMAIQYESLRNPLIIIFTIPFAYTSILLMINVLKMPVSMSLWLGVIMLTGIIVNNAIVLVEQIDRQRKQQNKLLDAIITAASLRLRPILMTSLTSIFGLMPLALGMGSGTELLQPLALVIIWGLSYSLLVSLLLIPCVYLLFYKRSGSIL